ncbi:hypothetical protein UYO_2263 [Lachnospiraceae bacterium JC7]|nr:hypothetical protein UYO_2263 [Lachnospiraceae bacterium JC7]
MANFCRNCGTKLTPGTKFCRNCGHPVSQMPLPPNNNTGIPPYVKKEDRFHIIMLINIILSVVLAVEAILVSFWQPGYLRAKSSDTKPGVIVTESITDTVNHTGGGNSDPLDITPIEGMRITAGRNALDKNREFKVRQATDEEIEKTADRLDDHALVVAAFDVDAGLRSEEYLPGTYEVELDMETLGIPESLMDQVMVVRMDENGSIFPYSTECDGRKIRYSSKQNSVSAIIVGTAAVLTMIGVPVYVENYDYSYYKNKTRTGIGNQHFILEWAVEDFEHFGEFSDRSVELDKALTVRSRELYEEALKAIPEEMYRTTSNGQVVLTAQADTARRSDVLKTWKELCDRDSQYQELKNELAESYPDVIKELYHSAELAWDYLTGPEQSAKMPSYQVEILLKRKLEDTEADTHKLLYKGITVNLGFEEVLYPKSGKKTVSSGDSVNPLSFPDASFRPDYGVSGDSQILDHDLGEMIEPQDYDRVGMENMLLTMVHELFHVSQFMYYSSAIGSAYTSNVRLFEAQANVVEAQAFTSFLDRGLLPHCAASGFTVEDETQIQSHVLTLWNQWEYMAVPLDKLPDNKSQYNDSGYNEANYLEYMCKKHGNITMGKLMESFSAGQSFSRTVALAWNMTDEEQKNSYDAFLCELRDGKLPPSKVNASIYGANEPVSQKGGLYFSRNDMVYTDAPNLCYNRLQIAIPQYKDYALVISGLDTGHSGTYSSSGNPGRGLYEIRVTFDMTHQKPIQEVDPEHNIFFLPVQSLNDPGERLVYISELLRIPNGNKPGFELCAMLAPEKPELKTGKDGKKLEVTIPKMNQDKFFSMNSLASIADEMGILMTLEREDGVVFEVRFNPEKEGKTTELDIMPYLEDWDEKELPEFQCTIQEYFRIGETDYTGPKSDVSEKEKDDITPFLGQYKTEGVVLDSYDRVMDMRIIITEKYMRLPNSGENQLFYDSYKVDGDTLTLHFKNVDFDYIVTLKRNDRIMLQSTSTGSKTYYNRVPSGQERKEWGNEYDPYS